MAVLHLPLVDELPESLFVPANLEAICGTDHRVISELLVHDLGLHTAYLVDDLAEYGALLTEALQLIPQDMGTADHPFMPVPEAFRSVHVPVSILGDDVKELRLHMYRRAGIP
jgi:hypothetical protein